MKSLFIVFHKPVTTTLYQFHGIYLQTTTTIVIPEHASTDRGMSKQRKMHDRE